MLFSLSSALIARLVASLSVRLSPGPLASIGALVDHLDRQLSVQQKDGQNVHGTQNRETTRFKQSCIHTLQLTNPMRN